MADGENKRIQRGGKAAPQAALTPASGGLPSAMFTGPGMLALADLLPVMTGYVDATLTYRFMNKALAEWLGRPRSEMLGRTMTEVIGAEAFAARKPMLEAALGGERVF